MRLIDADRLKAHYCWWSGGSKEMTIDEAKKTFDTIVDVQPTVDIDAITESHEKIGYDKGFRDGYAQATVDAEPVRHGHWLAVKGWDDVIGELDNAECSVCHETQEGEYWAKTYYKYCPNCGAKMDESKEQSKGETKTNTVINTGEAMSTRTNQRGMNYYPNCGAKMDEVEDA